MSSSGINLEISEKSRHVEIGKLYELWQNRTAAIAAGNDPEEAVQIFSKLHHENIVVSGRDKCTFIGSLCTYFGEEKSRPNYTWAQRLRTCIGIAKGLRYLHLGVADHGRVIHGYINGQSVLLNENLEAKIFLYGNSVLVRGNQPHPEIYRRPRKQEFFDPCPIDPVYLESSILNIESDIYSYGILMFQILSGVMHDDSVIVMGNDYEQKLINRVRRFYGDGPEQLIDPYIIDNVDRRSFHMFIDIAYKCISLNIKDRPTMNEVVKTIEEALDIHLRESIYVISLTFISDPN